LKAVLCLAGLGLLAGVGCERRGSGAPLTRHAALGVAVRFPVGWQVQDGGDGSLTALGPPGAGEYLPTIRLEPGPAAASTNFVPEPDSRFAGEIVGCGLTNLGPRAVVWRDARHHRDGLRLRAATYWIQDRERPVTLSLLTTEQDFPRHAPAFVEVLHSLQWEARDPATR
jgi:hypothetical protein